MLSEATIDELRTILRENYDKALTKDQASQVAYDLTNYFDLLGKIYHREKGDEIRDHEKHDIPRRVA